MKYAYVSIVIPVRVMPSLQTIERIDQALSEVTRAHEIVFVTPYGESVGSSGGIELRGPLTIVTTHVRSSSDDAVIAGLARTVGDFVIEWRGPVNSITASLLMDLLGPSDSGVELVEATGRETSALSRLFNWVLNRLRPRHAPLKRSIGRTYSRHALQAVLGAAAFEPQLDVLIAELPVRRTQHQLSFPNEHHPSLNQRISNGFALLSRGTRFGTAIPLTLAAASALFGIAAALWALGFLFIRGDTPEGWTTLLVVIGLGQAVILTMLGLTWARIDSLARGLATNPDVTAQVEVIAPNDFKASNRDTTDWEGT